MHVALRKEALNVLLEEMVGLETEPVSDSCYHPFLRFKASDVIVFRRIGNVESQGLNLHVEGLPSLTSETNLQGQSLPGDGHCRPV